MLPITSESIQRWVRIGLYTGFGALAQYGITVPSGYKELAASIVGLVATAVWTMYGSRITTMLTEIEKTPGVDKVTVKVNADLVNADSLARHTPDNVVVQTSK